jgi:hypothetical protein
MSPKRLKGLGAFATSLSIYSYIPYLTVYLGSTVPIFSAVAAGLYGVLSFAESLIVNRIEVVSEGEHAGKLRLTIGQSPIISQTIIADVRNIRSVVSMGDADDIGEDGVDGNLIEVTSHIIEKTGEAVNEKQVYTLPGDAYRDR